jgi:hypothetical protein
MNKWNDDYGGVGVSVVIMLFSVARALGQYTATDSGVGTSLCLIAALAARLGKGKSPADAIVQEKYLGWRGPNRVKGIYYSEIYGTSLPMKMVLVG